MIEIENTKICLAVMAIGARYTSQMLAQALPEGFEVWLDQGATVFCIAVLSYLLKQERDERRERQKHHDEEARALQQKQSEETAASIAMRERLAVAMEKYSESIDRLSEHIKSK